MFLRKAQPIISLFLTLAVAMLSMVNMTVMAEETPANLTTDDGNGKMIPISLIKGRITSQASRYILGPGDVIDIRVKDLDEYDQTFSIRPDGYASIHPFGEYQIIGTDLQGLELWLEEKFKFYLLKPEVTANVKEMRPALVYVSGAVRRPGVYQYIRQGPNNATIRDEQREKVELTLSNVLKRSGGVTILADVNHVKVIHETTGQEEVFDIMGLLTGQAKDIWLLPGDRVEVPEMDMPMSPETFHLVSKSTFFNGKLPVVVVGAVNAQGEVGVDPQNNSISAAISLAGGYSMRGKQGTVYVQRPTSNGGYTQLKVHPLKAQFNVIPGDIVYVPESNKAKTTYALKVLNGLTLPFFFGTGALNNLNSIIGAEGTVITEVTGNRTVEKSKAKGLF